MRSLLPCRLRLSTVSSGVADQRRRSGVTAPGTLSHCRVMAWRSFSPA